MENKKMFFCVVSALLALASGVALIVWSKTNKGKAVTLSKIFGYIISILAVFAFVMTIILPATGNDMIFWSIASFAVWSDIIFFNLASMLLVLAGGIALIVWSKRNESKIAILAKIFGYIIPIITTFTFIITTISFSKNMPNLSSFVTSFSTMFSNLGYVLLALASGIVLIVWSKRNEGKAVTLAKIFGYVVSILTIFELVIIMMIPGLMLLLEIMFRNNPM